MAPCPDNPTAFGYLKWAVKEAKENRLLLEFATSYHYNREYGHDVFEAAWRALYDWDMVSGRERRRPRKDLG